MGTVTGYTADRMKAIEDTSIVDGDVVVDSLILRQRNGVEINAGNVRGPQGVKGDPGAVPEAPLDGRHWTRKDGVWVLAPGQLLGSASQAPSNFTNTGTVAISFPTPLVLNLDLPTSSVEVYYGGLQHHSLQGKKMMFELYVDDAFVFRTIAVNVVAGVAGEVQSRINTMVTGLTIATHKFEIKVSQSTADATHTISNGLLRVRVG